MCNSLNTVFLLRKHLLIFSHEKSNGIVLLVLFMMLDVLVLQYSLCSLNPGKARHGLRGWEKTLGVIGITDTFIPSWLVQQPYKVSLLADEATVARAIT